MSTESVRVGQRTVEVSNAGKVLFPRDGTTKCGLVDYYQRVAPAMVPHLRGRPVAMRRFPDGIEGENFFQKDVPEHFPSWVRRVTVPRKEGGEVTHAVCDDAATLIYLAAQACITPHTWLSRAEDLDTPDRLVFDLDPAGDDLELLRFAVHRVGGLLEELGLVPFAMTTGSRGFHVTVPLRRENTFDEVRGFARDAAHVLATRHPDQLTSELPKERRGGRLFLDYLRNSYAQTSVPPYAVRGKEGAPAATPLTWDEVDRTEPGQFTVHDLPDRLDRHGDPWTDLARRARSLNAPRRRLQRILEEDTPTQRRREART